MEYGDSSSAPATVASNAKAMYQQLGYDVSPLLI
jgi:hypothetical protein